MAVRGCRQAVRRPEAGQAGARGEKGGKEEMELKVLLHGEHVLTLEPGLGYALPEDRMEWRPGAERLSVAWEGRRPAEDVRQWLEHLLPEGEESTVFRGRAEMVLREHRSPAAKAPDTVAGIWGNADREYAGAVGFVAVGDDGREVRWPAHDEDDRYDPIMIAARAAARATPDGTRRPVPAAGGMGRRDVARRNAGEDRLALGRTGTAMAQRHPEPAQHAHHRGRRLREEPGGKRASKASSRERCERPGSGRRRHMRRSMTGSRRW